MSLILNSKLNNENLIKENKSFSEITQKTDYSDINSNNSPKIQFKYTSPIISYYDISNKYLLNKYSKKLNFEKSKNFIRKKSFDLNSNSDYSNDDSLNNYINKDDINQRKTNNIYYQNTNLINQNILNQPIFNFNINNQFNIINSNQNLNKNIINSKNNNITNNNIFMPLFTSNVNNNIIEMNGKKGWICYFCNNFNYENRIKCNRCQRNKNPKILKKNNNNNVNIKNNNNVEYKKLINPTTSFIIINNKKSQKHFSERIGDWTCFSCKNLNFTFRNVCNRCKLPKERSNLLLKQFNNINLFQSEN